MKYANIKRRVTTTRNQSGHKTGEIEAVSKPGEQHFKYQEVQRRQAAEMEKERRKTLRLEAQKQKEEFRQRL